jgi:hypothetical protein
MGHGLRPAARGESATDGPRAEVVLCTDGSTSTLRLLRDVVKREDHGRLSFIGEMTAASAIFSKACYRWYDPPRHRKGADT